MSKDVIDEPVLRMSLRVISGFPSQCSSISGFVCWILDKEKKRIVWKKDNKGCFCVFVFNSDESEIVKREKRFSEESWYLLEMTNEIVFQPPDKLLKWSNNVHSLSFDFPVIICFIIDIKLSP